MAEVGDENVDQHCDNSSLLAKINNPDNQDETNRPTVYMPDTSLTIPSEFQSFVDNGQNSTSVLCQRCASVLLRPRNATFTQKQVYRPNLI